MMLCSWRCVVTCRYCNVAMSISNEGFDSNNLVKTVDVLNPIRKLKSNKCDGSLSLSSDQ